MHAERTALSATARSALEYLADRSKQSAEASKIADWIKKSVPKTQAALAELRDKGLVQHFPEKGGHAGLWAVTPAGYQAVDGSQQSPDRFRMALEAICELDPGYSSDAKHMQAIARKALKR